MKKSFILLSVIIFFTIGFGYSARALSMNELLGTGKVAGTVVYKPILITSPQNASLKLTMQALNFENGKWKYEIDWNRTLKTRIGSVYITPKTDKQIYAFKDESALAENSQNAFLNPSTRYRIEFYSQPLAGGVLLLRKFFDTLPAPETVIACTMEAKLCPDGSYVSRTGPNCNFAECPRTPAAVCDYAQPPQGCNYENGPSFNSVTQCGKILVCPTKASSTVPFISEVMPTSGPVGTTVVLNGRGFLPGSYINLDGQRAGMIPNSNVSGTSTTFTIPSSLAYGCENTTNNNSEGFHLLCDQLVKLVLPGQHTLTILSVPGVSNSVVFTVTESTVTSSSTTLTTTDSLSLTKGVATKIAFKAASLGGSSGDLFPAFTFTQTGALPPGMVFGNRIPCIQPLTGPTDLCLFAQSHTAVSLDTAFLNGTPTVTGSFPIIITAIDQYNNTVTKSFTIIVSNPN